MPAFNDDLGHGKFFAEDAALMGLRSKTCFTRESIKEIFLSFIIHQLSLNSLFGLWGGSNTHWPKTSAVRYAFS